jgi:hypothetical protein
MNYFLGTDGKIFVSTGNTYANDTGARVDQIIMLYDPAYHTGHDKMHIYPNPTTQYGYIVLPATTNNCISRSQL